MDIYKKTQTHTLMQALRKLAATIYPGQCSQANSSDATCLGGYQRTSCSVNCPPIIHFPFNLPEREREREKLPTAATAKRGSVFKPTLIQVLSEQHINTSTHTHSHTHTHTHRQQS